MRTAPGFTLIELMIVIAIIGIMATYALPSYQDRVIRAQVSEGLGLAEFARQSVQAYYSKHRRMPKDNAAAGLPPADRIMGNYVTSLAVADGAIVMTFGNRSNRNITGKKLSLRPAVVEGYPSVPLSWVCGIAAAPGKMRVLGSDQTDLPAPLLPIDCR
jgi:type IV pilus assembly protein PilA